ncbi:MAG: hypothetical protein L3K09_03335 [Thermoplasmata archaeon]|nr:hypothetical protein [Thermoplasmata archaeon]
MTAWGVSPKVAREGARALFSLEHPLEEFYQRVRAEPTLRGTERRFRGLRIPRDPSVYESLIYSVIGQQLSVQAANTIKSRLFERVGSRLEVEGIELNRIPTPAEISALGVDGLRSVGMSGAKSVSLLALANRESSGAFDAAELGRLSRERAVEQLDREKGVGVWTAENALLRGVGRRDLFIAGDLGVRAALAAYRVHPLSAPESEVRAWADAVYPGWGSYATLYLWRRWVSDGTPRAPKSPARSSRRPMGNVRASSGRRRSA